MKIGIFFGGQSREREVSFAGGRTVYDNLNKNIFQPIPIFVDSLGNFILLHWQYIYKGTIRDFYPPTNSLVYKKRHSEQTKFQIYIESLGKLNKEELQEIIDKVGQKIEPHQFTQYFDFAFLALHGSYGEDGNIQGLLEWYNIPYSGSGILPSALGINKMLQTQVLENAGFRRPKQKILARKDWFDLNANDKSLFLPAALEQHLGKKIVIKSPTQGSSIGVSIIDLENTPWRELERAINQSFFSQETFLYEFKGSVVENVKNWNTWDEAEKIQFITQLTDIRDGIGFPLFVQEVIERDNPNKENLENKQVFYHPQELYDFLENNDFAHFLLSSTHSEEFIILEEFIEGREFSCIVIQEEEDFWIDSQKRSIHERGIALDKVSGKAIALPPTEIQKYEAVFDYRSKYLPGMSRKITPIDASPEKIAEIREQCERLFKVLNCNVYARIDGFLTENGDIFLNDPNTTSGMLPSSFFFHQAAEIGLNPSQFLTYLIRTSLAERIKTGKDSFSLRQMLKDLDAKVLAEKTQESDKIKVGVIMGGFSTERHISMESGRNIYEKLASSTKYEPYPIFLTGNEEHYDLYLMPVNIMLKDNADDIRDKILNFAAYKKSEGKRVLEGITEDCENIRQKYVANPILEPQKISLEDLKKQVSEVFIALHGRPGEDGSLQVALDKFNIPYNGSGVESSKITINKYETNEILRKKGFLVAEHDLVFQKDWQANQSKTLEKIEAKFRYPIIAKPADDGCSSAVKKIKSREELTAFAEMMFRPLPEFLEKEMQVLKLKANEEFPQKNYFLIEELITKNEAVHFLEITGGMLTHFENGKLKYEVFEPSETLALGEVLSLEEKFLAGEGQNITPARYLDNAEKNTIVSEKVREVLEKVAQTLNIEGYARIDAFVRIFADLRVEVIIIEVNSLPGMTPATCIFHQSAINNYKPYHFIDAILSFGRERIMGASVDV